MLRQTAVCLACFVGISLLVLLVSDVSGGDDQKVSVQFKNNTDCDFELFWLDTSTGKEVSYGVVRKGKTYDGETFNGHVWIIRNARGEELGRTTVKTAPGSGTVCTLEGPQANLLRKGSGDNNQKVPVQFKNNTDGDFELFWLDTSTGKEVSYGVVRKGKTYDGETFNGHVWIIRNARGEELGRTTVKTAPGSGTIFALEGPQANLLRKESGATGSGVTPREAGPRLAARVTEIPEEVRKKYNLDTDFYKKHVDYKGFSILGSAKVSDAALLEARYLIDQLLGDREDVLKAMIKHDCRFMVMAPSEMTTDVPEQRYLKNDRQTNWDTRARGLGGVLSSCGEENLLNLKGDRYDQENILIHEFNHAIHEQGLKDVDPTFDRRLRQAYDKAMDKGLWKGTYVVTNHIEYWAEGVQAYFDCMRSEFGANTREKLKDYDPGLFALVDELYKQSKFRYVRYDKRK